MKKQLLGLLAILTIFAACQKSEVTSLSQDVTIHATMEEKDVTRTVMDENNNILWSENDQIIAFMKSSYGHKYQVKPSFVGKSYADFSVVSSGNDSDLSAGNELSHNVVYYPYSENIECLKSGANYTLNINLPAEQAYVPNSFADGSMAMVAVSENNNITFKNVLGGMSLQLKGDKMITSLKVQGKNDEKLSGAATVTAYTDGTKPHIKMSSGSLTYVELKCGGGVQLNEEAATEFIIGMPPTIFSKGFKVTITYSDGKEHVIETDKENEIIRSSILMMPEVTIDSMPEDPQPGSISFKPRVLVTEFTATGCIYSHVLRSLFKNVVEDEKIADMVTMTSCHPLVFNNYQDKCYIQTKYDDYLGLNGIVPFAACDMDSIFGVNSDTSVESITNSLIELCSAKEGKAAGLAATSTLKDGILTIKTRVKAAETRSYNIGAFLLEDGIFSRQSGTNEEWQNYHNNVIRYIDGNQPSGNELGEIEAYQTTDYTFVWDLDSIWETGSRKSQINAGCAWDPFVEENLHVVVYALTSDEGDTSYTVSNVIDFPIRSDVAFEYN